MIEMIYLALALYFIQLILPSTIALLRKEVSLAYLATARDTTREFGVLTRRAQRACFNLQESLLVFLPIAVLAIYLDADTTRLACYWLGLRVVYLLVYLSGVAHLRTLVWFASVVVLIMMALALS